LGLLGLTVDVTYASVMVTSSSGSFFLHVVLLEGVVLILGVCGVGFWWCWLVGRVLVWLWYWVLWITVLALWVVFEGCCVGFGLVGVLGVGLVRGFLMLVFVVGFVFVFVLCGGGGFFILGLCGFVGVLFFVWFLCGSMVFGCFFCLYLDVLWFIFVLVALVVCYVELMVFLLVFEVLGCLFC